MPRQRRTTKYNLINVPEGFIDQRGQYLGSITPVECEGKIRFYARRYNVGKPAYPHGYYDLMKAKEHLLCK